MAVSARSGVDLHRAVSALSHGQSALFRYRDGQVYLAKCSEPLPTPANRQLPKGADPSTVTVKLAPSGRWFVSLLVDVDIDKLPASPHQVGLDLGIGSQSYNLGHLSITSVVKKSEKS
jgi:hypothetical protein